MITIENIKDWSKPHPAHPKGRRTVISDGTVVFSIVGGSPGLYGDFEEDFEVAIFEPDMENFITKFFFPEGNDDVIPYMKAQELEELVNSVIRKDFQVK